MKYWLCVFVLAAAGAFVPDAAARKLAYAMPPEPALSGGLSFKVAEPLAPATGEETPKRGLLVVTQGLFLDDARTMFYRQDFGGGGLAVGLLFGPLGAGANAMAIQNANEKEAEALRGRFRFSPAGLLAKAVQSRAVADGANPAANEAVLVPSLYVTRDSEERLIFWAILDVSIGEWRGRYSSLAQGRVPLLDAAKGLPDDQMVNLEWAIESAYARGLDALAADASGTLTGFKPQKMDISALSPRFHKPVRYEHVLLQDDRVIVRGLSATQFHAVGGFGFSGVLVMPGDAVKLR